MNIFFPAGGRRVELISIFKEKVEVLAGRIVVGDIVNTSPALYVADKSYLLPNFNSEECYGVFRNICKKEKIDLVIPLIDYELDYYAANYMRMQTDGINVMMSAPKSIEIFRNKKKTNETLRKLGIPTPVQYNWEEKEKKFPLIIKPVKGSAGMRINVVEDQAELEMINSQIGNTRVKEEFVLEEFVQGVEVTSDVLIDHEGNIRAIAQRERIKVRGGEVERAKVVDYKDINKNIELIFSSIEGIGVLNIQCFLSKDGPKFTEINARFGGGYPLSYQAGCDFPEAIMDMYNNKPISTMNAKVGYYMLRYDNAIYLNEDELIND